MRVSIGLKIFVTFKLVKRLSRNSYACRRMLGSSKMIWEGYSKPARGSTWMQVSAFDSPVDTKSNCTSVSDSYHDDDMGDDILEEYHKTAQKGLFLRALTPGNMMVLLQKANEEYKWECRSRQGEMEQELQVNTPSSFIHLVHIRSDFSTCITAKTSSPHNSFFPSLSLSRYLPRLSRSHSNSATPSLGR